MPLAQGHGFGGLGRVTAAVKRIALCMIVKDEAHIIRRCLEHARPLIDYVLIVDTGSADNTELVVRDFLRSTGLPGEIVKEPWRDFAYNRTSALAKARALPKIDYSMMIDADEVILFDERFDINRFKESLTLDIYDLRFESENVEYLLPQLASNKVEVSYEGVLHEFRVCPDGCSRGVINGIIIRQLKDGARSQNKDKYYDDVLVLKRALDSETDPFLIARYKFYLAQSYRDAGEIEKAIKTYLERGALGGWDEEVCYSLYSAAKLMAALDYPNDEVINAFLDAGKACPRRAEPLHGAASFCRKVKRYQEGYELAKKGLLIRCPKSGLFIERWIYDYGLLDEHSLLAYHCARYSESMKSCLRLLEEGRIPPHQQERIRQNAKSALDKLEPPSSFIERVPPKEAMHSASLPAEAVSIPVYVVITPYYAESREKLERCIDSVRRQSIKTDHILVADGIPQDWLDGKQVRHIRLDRTHSDFGSTPRGLGALMAVTEGYKGIAFLDADNWFAENHIEHCLAAAEAVRCDYVIAKRFLMSPDGVRISDLCDEAPPDFVDTSCFFLLPPSYHCLWHWLLMPKPLSPICDRAFYAAIKSYRLRATIVEEPTVYYECLWASVYESAGLPIPPGAKPNVDIGPILKWLASLTVEELETANTRAGFDISSMLGRGTMSIQKKKRGRNAPCPCGSGKRYKHCHGLSWAEFRRETLT